VLRSQSKTGTVQMIHVYMYVWRKTKVIKRLEVQNLPNLANSSTKKFRSLINACGYQQSTVAATLDDEFFGLGVAMLYKVLGCGLKIIKNVLFLSHCTTQMPSLPIFTEIICI